MSSVVFLLLAIAAAFFAFSGIVSVGVGLAKFLFFGFLVLLFVISVISGLPKKKTPPPAPSRPPWNR